MLSYARAYPDVVLKANRRIRDSAARRMGVAALQPRVPGAVRSRRLGHQRHPEALPPLVQPAAHAPQPNGDLIDAEFVLACKQERYPIIEIPLLATTRLGGLIHHQLPLRAADVPKAPSRCTAAGSTDERRGSRAEPEPEPHGTDTTPRGADPAQVVAQCEHLAPVAPELLRCGGARSDWWSVLERLDACLVVTREYEHLLLALTVTPAGPRRSFMALPHPSGLAYDAASGRLYVASTRNPNQLYTLAPADHRAQNGDRGRARPRAAARAAVRELPARPSLPARSRLRRRLAATAQAPSGSTRSSVHRHRLLRSRHWWPPLDPSATDAQISLATTSSSNSIAAGADLSPAPTSPPPPTRPPHAAPDTATSPWTDAA